MADSKITQLTETTSPANTDILPVVVDPSTTPITKYTTIQNAVKNAYDSKGDIFVGAGASAGTVISVGATNGQIMVTDSSSDAGWSKADRDFAISINLGGLNATSAYTGGTIASIECPYDGVIESIRMLGTSTAGTVSGAGTATLDIYKASYANFPSMGTAQSICGTATKPNLTGTAAYENTTLTGFTTTFSKGDWLTFVAVNSGFVWTSISLSGKSSAVS